MVEYKTVALPKTYLECKNKDLYKQETIDTAVSPVANAIATYAKEGWHLHSINTISAEIIRKKGLLEKLFGWIPLIGRLFIPVINPEDYYPDYCTLIFQREV